MNGEGWISFSCTPTNLEALAAGFLYNEAVISSANEISSAQIERQSSSASVSA
jgi:FdhD protein